MCISFQFKDKTKLFQVPNIHPVSMSSIHLNIKSSFSVSHFITKNASDNWRQQIFLKNIYREFGNGTTDHTNQKLWNKLVLNVMTSCSQKKDSCWVIHSRELIFDSEFFKRVQFIILSVCNQSIWTLRVRSV